MTRFKLLGYAILIVFATSVCVAQDMARVCREKYVAISDGFYSYNEKSAVSNAVMDRIDSYATKQGNEANALTIKPQDAREWFVAMDELVSVGQPQLQRLLEYQALKCTPEQAVQLQKMIDKATADLKTTRARQGMLMRAFPTEKFGK